MRRISIPPPTNSPIPSSLVGYKLMKKSRYMYFHHPCAQTVFGTAEVQPSVVCYQGMIWCSEDGRPNDRPLVAFGCTVNFDGPVDTNMDPTKYHAPVLAGIVTIGKHRALLLSLMHKRTPSKSFGSVHILNSYHKFKWKDQNTKTVFGTKQQVDTAWRMLHLFKKGYENSQDNRIPERVGFCPAPTTDQTEKVPTQKVVTRSRGRKASKKVVAVPKSKVVNSSGGRKKRKSTGSASEKDILRAKKKSKGAEPLDVQQNYLQLITSRDATRLAPVAMRPYENIVKLQLLNRQRPEDIVEVTKAHTEENAELKRQVEQLKSEQALSKERAIEEKYRLLQKDEKSKMMLRQKDEEQARLIKELQRQNEKKEETIRMQQELDNKQQLVDKLRQELEFVQKAMSSDKRVAVLETELKYQKQLMDTKVEGEEQKMKLLAGKGDEVTEAYKKQSTDTNALLMAFVSSQSGMAVVSSQSGPVQRGSKRSNYQQHLAIVDRKRRKKKRVRKNKGKQRATGGNGTQESSERCERCRNKGHGTIYCPEAKSYPLTLELVDATLPGAECARCIQPGHAPSHCPAKVSVPLKQLREQQQAQHQQLQMIPMAAPSHDTNASTSSSSGDALTE